MNYRPQPHSRTSAFTLVELLTVITIIAILMGLLFPAIGIAKDQARKAEARTAVMGITAAVRAYYTEYGKYPLGSKVPTGNPADVIFGDGTNDNAIVFNALRNLPDPLDGNNYNPRAILFFDGKTVADPTNPKSGFASQAGATPGNVAYLKGTYFDPWGNPYRISIDADYDNTIKNLPYTDFNTTNTYPQTGVAVFSVGKDGVVGGLKPNTGGAYRMGSNNSDDIVSWQ